jgi:hypothetical protein
MWISGGGRWVAMIFCLSKGGLDANRFFILLSDDGQTV